MLTMLALFILLVVRLLYRYWAMCPSLQREICVQGCNLFLILTIKVKRSRMRCNMPEHMAVIAIHHLKS